MNKLNQEISDIRDCVVCPRECGTDRTSEKLGWCLSGADIMVASICAHRGEEPVISGENGVCNLFFAHCNLQCIFCQNYQISGNRNEPVASRDIASIVTEIEAVLSAGAKGVGFVSPSHYIQSMLQIIEALKASGHQQTYLFNSNGYDKAATVKSLAGVIDVFLPDLKYMDESLGREYSGAKNYPEIATAAIKEMFYQKGANIYLDDDGIIESGLIIRHLVLPGQIDNSKAVLRWIADELSPAVHLSLMSQYHPTPAVADHPTLRRTLRPEEYQEVMEEFERLGFYRGWVQELESPKTYRPDFDQQHPFEQ